MLIAIGMKIRVFADVLAPGPSRSDSTATARPIATVTLGTMIIHSSVLISVCWKSCELSSLVKLSKPTHSVLVESWKEYLKVRIEG